MSAEQSIAADPRFARLPKWAQTRLLNQEADEAQRVEKDRAASAGETNVFIRDYLNGDRGLPPRSVIRFYLVDGTRLDASVDIGGESLRIYSHGYSLPEILVIPEAANVIRVRGGKR